MASRRETERADRRVAALLALPADTLTADHIAELERMIYRWKLTRPLGTAPRVTWLPVDRRTGMVAFFPRADTARPYAR